MLRTLWTIVGLLGAAGSEARTWYVKPDMTGDAPTIQAAIDSAASDDSVLVASGVYDENLDTQGKRLSLIGQGGAEQTIIDGGFRARVLTLSGGGLVKGFTLRRGQDANGGGVWVTGPFPAILRDNIIEDNIAGFLVDAGDGGGILLDDQFPASAIIESNVIRRNNAGDVGGGIRGRALAIRNNEIVENSCHNNGGGMFAGDVITSNVVTRNWSDNGTAGLQAFGIEIEISNNTVIGNRSGNSANVHGVGISLDLVVSGALVRSNIVAYNGSTGSKGAGIRCGSQVTAFIECNDIWGNDIDDIVYSPSSCSATIRDNFNADPQFCAVDPFMSLNRFIQIDSPCAPGNHPDGAACGLIGAAEVGCGTIAVENRTWSRLKQLYRE